MGEVLIGTASWTDKSLLGSGWYPSGVTSAADRLRFYAEHFALVEVDSTYYFPPSEKNSQLWAERTPAGFTFNVKAFSLLTQHPTKADALYKDLPRPEGKKNVYPDDLEANTIDEVWDRFLSALEPLRAAGKLGALLFQFPPWFVIARKNKDYILECAKRAAPLQIAVELRHNSWMPDENQKETLDFLEGHGLPYVCVDMPQGFKSSLPPVVAATADLAMVRFHGRNEEVWEKKTRTAAERFEYEYSQRELRGWVPKLEEMSSEAKETHAIMNNCFRNYAVKNARQLATLVE